MYKKYGVCIKKKINAFRSKQLLNNLCEKKQVTRNCLVEITSFFFFPRFLVTVQRDQSVK